MDSLTQITLGAAVGEVVLGRKVGNRAMVWGAIAGTLPDLDVFANAVTDEISALAYHRAFTHSVTFAVVTPLLLGALVHRLYGGKDGPLPRSFWAAFALSWALLLGLITIGSGLMPVEVYGTFSIALTVSAVIMLFPALARLRQQWRTTAPDVEEVSWLAWSNLFFWAILTHPLLDACTTYGTQLWEPFSSFRVAWNVISVADPLYTGPFLLCLIMASFFRRGSRLRTRFNWAGIIISSLYLLFCTYNHFRVNQVFETSTKEQAIAADRHIITPTILNNILWQGTAESDTAFFVGQYSLFDQEPRFQLHPLAKNHHLIQEHWDDRDIKILRWFSDGYFNIMERGDTAFQYNDLRFGGFTDTDGKPQDYVFYFILTEENGVLKARQSQERPDGEISELFGLLWMRIKGI